MFASCNVPHIPVQIELLKYDYWVYIIYMYFIFESFKIYTKTMLQVLSNKFYRFLFLQVLGYAAGGTKSTCTYICMNFYIIL